MTDPHISEVRDALDQMKSESGSGSKARKQDEFERIYSGNVGHLLAGERWDDAGIGPATAREAAEEAFGEIPDGPTLSESLAEMGAQPGDDSLQKLVNDLDELAELSGDEQKQRLVGILKDYKQPSLVTLALLDDETFGLGTSQMREVFFDGSREERKRAESLCDGTVDFITRAKNGTLPTEPQVMQPFAPMLAKPESTGRPENAVAQPKVDGYRLLLHIIDGEGRAYTRRQKDVTHSLPELNEIDWPAGSFIIDCEVIADDGTYKSTSERVGSKPENIDTSTEMHFACFDLIHKNGSDLTRKPYSERHEQLGSLLGRTLSGDDRVYQLATSSNIDEVKKYARKMDYEGVIIKNLYGEYEFGTRSSEWVKEKHEEESVDVVAVGFDEGDGRLDGTLGRIKLHSADGVPVGYTGSGFTDEQRDEIWENRDEYAGATLEVSGEDFDDGIRFPIFQRWRQEDGEPDDIDRIKEILT